ncbi:hypothetical protein [Rhodovulum sulfidophilum]|uniref:hypothetical protein n=1 Tax=Rhodovulum sulfidophilum TaxID=35806 RepID=UPI000952CF89|nr:hypothetical protein [Rhodovulum sulfidophilum]MBL3554420.1 hypothetical protein [Rhodovulum sulfidophilum]OLS47704.1 hypothetical protein BV379_04975 [Rhodovulum sulfidophilum]
MHEHLKAKGWKPDSVRSLGDASSEVVSLLGNPNEETFACRGLVVGHVQSGKTANMTAVMAKAVDAGYNLAILLGGVTNKLRQQTQDRFERGGSGIETAGGYIPQVTAASFSRPTAGSPCRPRDMHNLSS